MIFERVKDVYPKRYAKLFGITLFEWEYNLETYTYFRKILYGLITTKKVNNILESKSEKVLKILNIPIFRTVDDGESRFYYLFHNLKFKTTDLRKLLKKEYPHWFNKGYDCIFTVVCNSGESYLFFKHVMLPFMKKHGIKKPFVVCTKKYHTDVFKTLFPDIPVEWVKYSNRILKSPFQIDDITFYSIFPLKHFECFEKRAVSDMDEHYFNAILKTMNINEDEISNIKPNLPDSTVQGAINKAREINLDVDNFIFLSPESQSCQNDSNFWINVIKTYKEKGYDIFANLSGDELDIPQNLYKTCFLTFSEALALSMRAKRIVGLRSGFLEFISQSGVPMDVIYTDFKKRACLKEADSDYVQRNFTFKKLPFLASEVSEYKMNEYLKMFNRP